MARHDATETIIGVGASTVVHDQSIINSESRLAAELGITPWLAAGVVVPVRVFDTQIRYLDANGEPVAIENPYVHHHDETLVGLGDPWLLARFARAVGGFTLGARLGLALPLGRTEPDPFELGDMGIPHEHSQFGTGTVQPLLGIDAARAFGPVRVDAFALTIQSFYANRHGYQAGDRYAGGIGAGSALGTKRWRFRATVEAQHETAERWNGMVHTDEGNTGRTDVLVGVEVTWRITDDWHIGAMLKVPAYTHVQGGQLDVPAFFGLSLGTHVHVFEGDEHEHEHDHGHEHAPTDWSGLDKQDVTNDGSAVPLVPVAGKITVFDFWATWCEPCEVVDHELAELARRYPDAIAVRKVNIVDVDSPAAQKYLGDATLPHLKVFGRDRKLLWERSAAPLVLAGDVEKLLVEPAQVAAKPAPGAATPNAQPSPVAAPLEKPAPAPVAAKPTPVAAKPDASPNAKPTAGAAKPSPNAKPTPAARIAIEVTEAGYVPKQVDVPRGKPVVLVVTRKSDKTCATDMHFRLPDGSRIAKQLPLGTAVEIPLRIETPGTITYACGMDMIHGTIVVR